MIHLAHAWFRGDRNRGGPLCGDVIESKLEIVAPHEDTCGQCLAALAAIRQSERDLKGAKGHAMIVGIMTGEPAFLPAGKPFTPQRTIQ